MTAMPTITAEGYVLQLFLAEHTGHTQTKSTTGSGRMEYRCSCGVTLVLSKDAD
jgi:hypothetical protein